MTTETVRSSLVRAALDFTEGTPAAASAHERYLLDKYVRGLLSLDEVLVLLAAAEHGEVTTALQLPPGG